MAERSVSQIRNIALVGHGSSGKTTLVDHLLHAAEATNRAGSVDEGSSLSDYTTEEKERKFSIESAIFHFETDDKIFNLIDTPGYLDFMGAAATAIPVVETALVAVDASDGVRLNTRRTWQLAENYGVARMLMISHLDAENIQFERLLNDIQDAFGRECVPVFLPLGLGTDCSGVVNLLETEEAPEGVVGNFEELSQSLRESIIECDDELMERYLEGEEVSKGELETTFKHAILGGEIVPILCSAAENDIGVSETLDLLAACTPSPVEGPTHTALDKTGEEPEEVEVAPDPEAPFCGQVFKSVVDEHVGRLVYFRVYSGTLKSGDNIEIARTGETERLGHLYTVFGSEQNEFDTAVPGDIICVTKVEDVKIHDTLRSGGCKYEFPELELPSPMMSLAVEPQSRDDEQRINSGLRRLAEGDPTFTLERDKQSSELVITGMSNLHLEVMLSKLQRRYGVSADTHEPSIPYRETITTNGKDQYRHKKQTGGRGQYGEVYLRLEPGERGAGFEFVDEIKGGVIPNQFIPAVEKGIVETMEKGLLAGYPIVDVIATVYYGSYHDVDSSEAAFKIAGARAFQGAFERCRPTLLEPIVKIDVTIPSEYVGPS
ncbi:MAG: elongation factor G, partial [Planctomycetes bacterium]|nr:elongation factor G [Planctomycetota bacterium]